MLNKEQQESLRIIITLMEQIYMLEGRYQCNCRNEIFGETVRNIIKAEKNKDNPEIRNSLEILKEVINKNGDI